MEILKWVGIVAVIWFAAAVMVAVFWHRAQKARPRLVRPRPASVGDPLHWSDGSEVDPAELDAQVERGDW